MNRFSWGSVKKIGEQSYLVAVELRMNGPTNYLRLLLQVLPVRPELSSIGHGLLAHGEMICGTDNRDALGFE